MCFLYGLSALYLVAWRSIFETIFLLRSFQLNRMNNWKARWKWIVRSDFSLLFLSLSVFNFESDKTIKFLVSLLNFDFFVLEPCQKLAFECLYFVRNFPHTHTQQNFPRKPYFALFFVLIMHIANFDMICMSFEFINTIISVTILIEKRFFVFNVNAHTQTDKPD